MAEGLYDLADPSVNLHEFIVDCLSTPKDRLFLLHLEKDLIEFIEDDRYFSVRKVVLITNTCHLVEISWNFHQ
jgi:hypothetical protein